MINSDWPLRAVGELFEIGAGKTMSAAARDGAHKTPFLRTSNVLWDEIELTSVDEMAIPESELQGKLLRQGDLLVCEGGEIGRAAVWNGEREIMSFQNHVHRLRALMDDIEPRFYVYFLQSAFTQLGIFEGAGNKTTIPNLSRNRLAALLVPHPTIEEQQAIVQALGRVREATCIHDRSTSLAQELKQSAMQRLFTRGLKGERQKETEIGLVPETWEILTCDDVALQITVGVVVRPASYYVADGVPAFRSLNIKEDRLDASDLVFFASEVHESVLSKSRLNAGDVLVVRTGYPGTSCVVPHEFDGANCIDLVVVKPQHNRIDSRFLSRFLNSDRGKSQAVSNSHGLAQQHLNVGAVRQVKLPLPRTLEEQREIVSVLEAVDAKIALHRRKRSVLDELFESLLYKLMTGEIRVADLDLSVIGSKPQPAVAAL